MIYVALDTVLNETFADTASRDYLIMRCAERGITPLPATCAVGIGEFSMDIPIGTRFSCDKYNWAVTEKIESLKYYLCLLYTSSSIRTSSPFAPSRTLTPTA